MTIDVGDDPERFDEEHDDVFDDQGELVEPVDVDDVIAALEATLPQP